MSNIGLIIISVIFILSSLSEKIEFIVYNEEVLLALCFVLFVFFIYGYLNESVYNDFQKKIEGLEDQLFNVISEKFNTTLVHFNELFLLKGLEFKLSTIESLLYSRISSHFTLYRGQILKDKASSLVSISLFEILRSGSKITEKLQKKVIKTIF
jgi:Ca2+/Na+ antiporter